MILRLKDYSFIARKKIVTSIITVFWVTSSMVAFQQLTQNIAFSENTSSDIRKDRILRKRRRQSKKVRITIEMLDRIKTLPGNLSVLPGNAPVPKDNPQFPKKIELGKMLFFDRRLSKDSKLSCATCHAPDLGYADGRARAMGFVEELGRHTPTILNAAYNENQFWDGRSPSLEDQATKPILAGAEMNNTKEHLIKFLNSNPSYREMFNEVFGRNPTFDDVGKAIAAFERTIITPNSSFDRYMAGKKQALTNKEKKGLILFVSKASCSQCHNGANFTSGGFHNLGVPQVGPLKQDLGRYNVTKLDEDKRAFKTPTLRNIVLTSPYMHNGAFSTLEEVVDFYNEGGGEDSNKDRKIRPLNLSPEEKEDLISFLKSLTGDLPHIESPQLPE